MAKFQITNQQQAANILVAVDYMRGKFLKAEKATGRPIEQIHSDFTDETGAQWRVTIARLSSEPTKQE